MDSSNNSDARLKFPVVLLAGIDHASFLSGIPP